MGANRRLISAESPSLWVAIIAALVTALGSAPARAQDDPRPREAKAACAAGDVQRGIALLADLYAETDDMTWVFNQGRCYQQNGQLENALNRFREYLRRPARTTPENRAEAETFIAELEQQLRARPADRARGSSGTMPARPRSPGVSEIGGPLAPAPGGPGLPGGAGATVDAPASDSSPSLPLLPEGTVGAGAAALPGTSDPTVATASASPAGGGRSLLVGSAVLGGTGVLALAVAIVSSTKVRSLQKEVAAWSNQAAGTHSVSDWKDRQIAGDLHEKIQWVGYTAAALSLAGSATFLFLASRRAGEDASGGGRLSVLPSLLRGGAAATLSIAF